MEISGVLILLDKSLLSKRKVPAKNGAVMSISDQLSDAPKKRRGRPRQEIEKNDVEKRNTRKSEGIRKKKSPKKSPKKVVEVKKIVAKIEKPKTSGSRMSTPVERHE